MQLLERKFGIDATAQAQRAGQSAHLFAQMLLPGDHERPTRKLGWAWHEIGCRLSRHRSAYILQHRRAHGCPARLKPCPPW